MRTTQAGAPNVLVVGGDDVLRAALDAEFRARGLESRRLVDHGDLDGARAQLLVLITSDLAEAGDFVHELRSGSRSAAPDVFVLAPCSTAEADAFADRHHVAVVTIPVNLDAFGLVVDAYLDAQRESARGSDRQATSHRLSECSRGSGSASG
ncbi:MAG: hypothetical protein ACAI25_09245 [Planctomycetota bacterium]